MLYVGIVAGVYAGNAAAHVAGLDTFRAYMATLLLIAAGLVGAKLCYVAVHSRQFLSHPSHIWKPNRSGAVQYGAVFTVLLLSVPLLAALGLPFGAYWDTAIFTFLVIGIVGRVGCLMNGCCAGRPSESWMSVCLPNRFGVWSRRVPTQGLEAGWSLALLLAAVVVRSRLPASGVLSWAVLGGHACGRLVLESTREDRGRFGRFAARQIASVVLVLLSLTALAAGWLS